MRPFAVQREDIPGGVKDLYGLGRRCYPLPPSKYDRVCKWLKAGWLWLEVSTGGACKVFIRGGLEVRYDFLKELARRKLPGGKRWISLYELMKGGADPRSVPQRLKPQRKGGTYGTAKAVPLRESAVFQ